MLNASSEDHSLVSRLSHFEEGDNFSYIVSFLPPYRLFDSRNRRSRSMSMNVFCSFLVRRPLLALKSISLFFFFFHVLESMLKILSAVLKKLKKERRWRWSFFERKILNICVSFIFCSSFKHCFLCNKTKSKNSFQLYFFNSFSFPSIWPTKTREARFERECCIVMNHPGNHVKFLRLRHPHLSRPFPHFRIPPVLESGRW